MKWHIVGSEGYIGKNLVKRLPASCKILRYDQCDGVDHKLDLTNLRESDYNQIEAGDFVVFLAAISSPDVCEKQYDFAYRINVIGTEEFIQQCINKGANVLFFSSDVVNGATTPLFVDEQYEGNPVGKYGQMKRTIEKRFYGNPHFKVFRLSYVYSKQDKFSKYLDICSEKKEVPDVFDALYRSVVYLEDIFDAIKALQKSFEEWDNTIFNLSGPELLSRKDIALKYVKIVDKAMRFVATMPPDSFFEARPNVIATKSLYLNKLLGRSPTSIELAMKKEYNLE